ncbi:MAG: peroxiredoxin [Nitrososphaeria archaeon]|nr:peroxiredoxin [Nitrososphaeria archaeon]
MLKIGSPLPEIRALDQNGEEVNFKDFIGKVTVIYFYPKDFTPGCTKEACSFRDNIGKFNNINVVGVSVQDVDSHKKFYLMHSLNFTLIADNDKKVSETFGVLRPTGVAERITFIFDKDGILRYIFDKVNPENHAEEVLAKIRELGLL